MQINKDVLKKLKPCTERYKNYLEHYAEFDGTFAEFLDLPLISYEDKIWVAKKMLSSKQLVRWAALCAQSVLHIFEDKYPNDKRPRECIDFLLSGREDKSELEKHKRAASTAAMDAYAVAAAYAAAAAAVHAANTAAADAADAAYAADAADAAVARKAQQSKTIEFLKSLIKELEK